MWDTLTVKVKHKKKMISQEILISGSSLFFKTCLVEIERMLKSATVQTTPTWQKICIKEIAETLFFTDNESHIYIIKCFIYNLLRVTKNFTQLWFVRYTRHQLSANHAYCSIRHAPTCAYRGCSICFDIGHQPRAEPQGQIISLFFYCTRIKGLDYKHHGLIAGKVDSGYRRWSIDLEVCRYWLR